MIASENLRDVFLKGYNQTISVFDDCRVSIESERWKDPNWLSSRQDKKIIKIEYIKKGIKERISNFRQSDPNPEDSLTYDVYDGIYTLNYLSTKNTSDTGTKIGRAVLGKPSEYKGLLFDTYNSPLNLFSTQQGIFLKDILPHSNTIINNETQIVEGLSCYQVQANVIINKVEYKYICWLCPDRSFVPVKTEIRGTDGTLLRQAQVVEFQELGNGQWYSKKIVHKSFQKKDDGSVWNYAIDTHTITEFELQPDIEDKIFSTSIDDLSAGTLFIDSIAGLQYYKSEGSVSDERLEMIIEEVLNEIPLETESDIIIKTESSLKASDVNELVTIPLLSDSGVLTKKTEQVNSVDANNNSVLSHAAIGFCTLTILAILIIFLYIKQKSNKGEIND